MDLRENIFENIRSLSSSKEVAIANETVLLGSGSVLDSMKLIELCIRLEDLATEHGFQFDWTSESAMSRSHSMFRTAGTLADAFFAQMEAAPK